MTYIIGFGVVTALQMRGFYLSQASRPGVLKWRIAAAVVMLLTLCFGHLTHIK